MTVTTSPETSHGSQPLPAPGPGSGNTSRAGRGTSMPTVRYTLAQMRLGAGRLVAAGIAIVIGTAFVAAALLTGNVMNSAVGAQATAGYAEADAVVTTDGTNWRADVEALRNVEGVADAQAQTGDPLEFAAGDHRLSVQTFAASPEERLNPVDLTEGEWPAARGEVVVTDGLAETLEVGVGDQVDVITYADTATSDGAPQEIVSQARVTGIAVDSYGAFTMSGGAVGGHPQDISEWSVLGKNYGGEMTFTVALDESAMSGDALADGTAQRLTDAVNHPGAASAQSLADHVESVSGDNQIGTIVFMVFVLGFATIALFVAALVIANTFQVLVAQRTRTLALLRCIGAHKGQLYRSVLLEAAILGALASLAGILLAVVLVQGALFVAPNFDLGIPLPDVVDVTVWVVVAPLAIGVLTTVLAAIAPARGATRVAPIAALRPADAISLRRSGGTARFVFALLLVLSGFALLGLGSTMGLSTGDGIGVLITVFGGGISFTGIVLGSIFWLPKVAGLLGRAVARSGPAAKLAAANTLRNPRRTSATATALMIGVTLVMTMATGAASAKEMAAQSLDGQFPVDLQVVSGIQSVSENHVGMMDDIEAIDRTAVVRESTVWIDGEGEGSQLLGVVPDEARGVVSNPDVLDALQPGTIMLGESDRNYYDVKDGDTVTVKGPDGNATLTVVAEDSLTTLGKVVTLGDLQRIDADPGIGELWSSFLPDVDEGEAVLQVNDTLGNEQLYVMGAASQRASFEQVIDVMLGVLFGLLGVAVVIALIGVTNTLSLSVIERTKENATLRAIGLSKAQLRGTLAIEGMLIAMVGALVGILIGLVYGWAGANSALSELGDLTYTVPWRDLLIVVALALVAGALASAVPAHNAVRTSPVEALSNE